MKIQSNSCKISKNGKKVGKHLTPLQNQYLKIKSIHQEKERTEPTYTLNLQSKLNFKILINRMATGQLD